MKRFLKHQVLLKECLSVCSQLRLFSGISNTEARQPGKAPNFSVNWTVGDQALEVINATTGKDDMGRASRLCKNILYSHWVRLQSKVYELNFCQDCSVFLLIYSQAGTLIRMFILIN